jgi:RNA polymerase sigma-70 factor (ECF subfamily)
MAGSEGKVNDRHERNAILSVRVLWRSRQPNQVRKSGRGGAVPTRDERTDLDLVADANRGDGTAFEVLYYRYRDWVAGLAFRITGHREDALDVLQETFAYFFGKFPGFELTAQVKTFLYPAVRHLALGRLRKRRPAMALPDDGLMPTAAADPHAGQGLAAVEDLLAPLAPAEREVVLLRFVDDLPLADIAEALGIPLGTVKSRLHNALRKLRHHLDRGKHANP